MPSEVLALHSYSSQSPSRTSVAAFNHANYPYPHYTQDTTSTDLVLLANHFSRHSIRAESNEYTSTQHTPHTISPPPRPTSQNCSVTARRAQRQANTLLQCQASHARQIAVLLEQMIAAGEQCNVCYPGQQIVAETPVWEEDETLGEMDEEDDDMGRPVLAYRRSADLSNQQGYVNKTVRVRKRGQRGGGSNSSR